MPDPLEPRLQTAVSYHVGAGNPTGVLCKEQQALLRSELSVQLRTLVLWGKRAWTPDYILFHLLSSFPLFSSFVLLVSPGTAQFIRAVIGPPNRDMRGGKAHKFGKVAFNLTINKQQSTS